MDSQPMDSTIIDEIAEEFSAAFRRGEAPSVEQFVARYPDAPPELRGLLTSIAMIEGLKGPMIETSAARSANEPVPAKLGDYTVVREIGRGGMGIVYEAIHESLGRRVALKLLSARLLDDPRQLARFRREARAAAKLRHGNIVPVFGVGRESGHHYYVMDYIDGISLREAIEALAGRRRADTPPLSELPPSTHSLEYYRWAAGIGATIYEALDYAHGQHVLHRDVKPANLLLDRQGDVWITDFGLAKLIEQQGITATGDIMGTPQYMPPESFEGRYDLGSEIYAAGLTLYELVTLRPAIDGKGPADVVRRAAVADVRPVRAICPKLPRDLATILTKCLESDPRRRYATAAAVRDDLNRFLSDRPIAARPAGPVERTLRWSRRQPMVASLTFSTLGLLVALTGVSLLAYLQTKSALDDVRIASDQAERSLAERTDALAAAERQRGRAEQNLQVALAAFETIIANLADRGVVPETDFFGDLTDTTPPNISPADAQLLQSLLPFFDRLADNNSEDLLAESALAARRAGEIYQRLGQLRSADRAYSESLRRYLTLSQRHPQNIDFTLLIAELQNELAVIAGLRGELGRAHRFHQQTVQRLSDSPAALATAAGRFQYARSHRLFASIRGRSGIDPFGSRPRQAGSPGRRSGGSLIRLRVSEELAAIQVAVKELESLVAEVPDELRYRVELARAYRDGARSALLSKQRQVVESAIEKSIQLFEQLLSEHPDSAAIRYELAATLASPESMVREPIKAALRAAELTAQLLASSPDQPRYLALRADSLTGLARFQARSGRWDPATDNLDQAVAIYDSLATKSPELTRYGVRRAQALEAQADLRHQQGKPDEAVEIMNRASAQLQSAYASPEPSQAVRMQLLRMNQKLQRWSGHSRENHPSNHVAK